MRSAPSNQGFTLIELMVGLALTVFLLMLAMPSISTYIMDSKIRAAAQAYHDGAQLARAEALRRNTFVAIGLKDSGRSWEVKDGDTLIAEKAAESSAGLKVKAEKTGVCFDSRGRASEGNRVDFESVNRGCMAKQGKQRCLRVLIAPGGQVRLCDPAVSAEGDNRKC